ncbi:MAG: hypothetical protein QM802_07820 [Agriterribacter sp.]
MERIGVLINKLQELHQQNASPDQLIHTVQMLQTELFLVKQQHNGGERRKIAVVMPAGITANDQPVIQQPTINNTENKIVEPVKIEEEEKKYIEPVAVKKSVAEVKPAEYVTQTLFNVFEEVPTLAHQPMAKELNEVIGNGGQSLNEKLHEQKKEVGEKLKDEPLKDIKKAIGVNDRYIFITELFRGDEAMYERSLKTINHFTIYPEAEFWIQRELKLKLGWKEDHPFVKQFDQLVRRRFL